MVRAVNSAASGEIGSSAQFGVWGVWHCILKCVLVGCVVVVFLIFFMVVL